MAVYRDVAMNNRHRTKYVHEGPYVAEIEIQVIMDETEWSPYLSLEDAYKLDDAREALRSGDLELASHYGRVYELRPILNQQA